jgi:hypothetical protein
LIETLLSDPGLPFFAGQPRKLLWPFSTFGLPFLSGSLCPSVKWVRNPKDKNQEADQNNDDKTKRYHLICYLSYSRRADAPGVLSCI